MTVRIGHLEFDHVDYDEPRDVLYLSIGEPREAHDALETPEGHVIRYDANDEVVAITLVNAKWLLERNGSVNVTLPISAEQLTPAFA